MVYSHGGKWTSTCTSVEGFFVHPRYLMLSIYISIAATHIQCAATSTDVEHAFSHGGLTVSKMQHSLSNESTCVASILGAWCDLPGARSYRSLQRKDQAAKG
jgi:hypothetical protein